MSQGDTRDTCCRERRESLFAYLPLERAFLIATGVLLLAIMRCTVLCRADEMLQVFPCHFTVFISFHRDYLLMLSAYFLSDLRVFLSIEDSCANLATSMASSGTLCLDNDFESVRGRSFLSINFLMVSSHLVSSLLSFRRAFSAPAASRRHERSKM